MLMIVHLLTNGVSQVGKMGRLTGKDVSSRIDRRTSQGNRTINKEIFIWEQATNTTNLTREVHK